MAASEGKPRDIHRRKCPLFFSERACMVMKHKQTFEVIILGRGGQGAKTTAEMLVQAAVRRGKFVQAFPEFGPERSGAPMRTFVRISVHPIRTHQPVVEPDCLIVLDESLLSDNKLLPDQLVEVPIIVNTEKTKADCQAQWGGKFHFIPINASAMAKEIIGESRPNTVILGTFAFVTEQVSVDDLAESFYEKYHEKIGPEKTNKNIEAIRRAYDHR